MQENLCPSHTFVWAGMPYDLDRPCFSAHAYAGFLKHGKMEINGSFLTTHLPKFPYSNPFPSSTLTNFSQPGNKRSKSVHCSVSAPSQTKESVPWGCDIDSLENASRLQKWLSKEGLPPQKLAIQRVDVGGRGLVALKNIRNGEKLLFVPQNLIITTDSVSPYPGQS
eukprot:Gb_10724 [translate_table: standard]